MAPTKRRSIAPPASSPRPAARRCRSTARWRTAPTCWTASPAAGPTATEAEVRIIAVDLPATVSWDTSGFGTDMFVLVRAALTSSTEADRIAAAHGAGPLPVVVNLSYGHSGGPHDQTALIAAAFDELVEARRQLAPTAVVIPSGNSFLDRLHAVLEPNHSDFRRRLSDRRAALDAAARRPHLDLSRGLVSRTPRPVAQPTA